MRAACWAAVRSVTISNLTRGCLALRGLPPRPIWTTPSRARCFRPISIRPRSTGSRPSPDGSAFAQDRWLAYAKGGWAGANIELKLNEPNTGIHAGDTSWANGWTVGGGGEYALGPHLSLGVEYDYAELDTGRSTLPCAGCGNWCWSWSAERRWAIPWSSRWRRGSTIASAPPEANRIGRYRARFALRAPLPNTRSKIVSTCFKW